MSRLVLILGAKSDIARAIARAAAAEGDDLALAARDPAALSDDAADLHLRHGVTVTCHSCDVLTPEGGREVLAGLPRLPDVVICCIGWQPETPMPADVDTLRRALRSNGEGPILLLSAMAFAFKERGHGTIIALASVAGLRGRAANGAYGAGKAALIAWLSALRNDPDYRALRIVTVLPGFVDSGMTAGRALPAGLTASPDQVARRVLRAAVRGPEVVYIRPVWRWIMAVITLLPEAAFKWLKL
jgi:decaprenylphospho-beta-D-erythro-pentofuranosid-2-ulose 2-reductase